MTREHLKLAAKAAVSLGLLAYLFLRIDVSAVAERLGAMSVDRLVELAALAAAQVGVLLIRWRLVLARSGQHMSGATAVSNICMGLLFNQVLLSAIGGDAVRVVHLTRLKIGVERAFTLVLVDRLTALLGMVLLIGLTLPGFFWRDDPTGTLAAAGLALSPLAAGGLVGFILLALFPRPPLLHLLGGIGRFLSRFWGALRAVLARPQAAGAVLGLALLIHVMTSLNAYAIAQAFDMPVSFLDCLMLVPPVFLLATLPLSVGGWGVREGGFVFAFAMVGLGETDAMALSVSMGLLGVFQGVLGGVIWLALDAGRAVGKTPSAGD